MKSLIISAVVILILAMKGVITGNFSWFESILAIFAIVVFAIKFIEPEKK